MKDGAGLAWCAIYDTSAAERGLPLGDKLVDSGIKYWLSLRRSWQRLESSDDG